jgi:outer membrane protein assembly factor BamA
MLDRKESYSIDSLLFEIADTRIDSLVKGNSQKYLLKKGNRYDQAVLTAERGRLYELMSNNGYYDFSRQYISFAVDSASLPTRGVIIKTIILNPPNSTRHKVFTLDSVFFTTDSDIKGLTAPRQKESYNGVIYRYYFKQYSKKIIDWRQFLYPGDLYSKENTFETQRQLSNLDIYKFINIKYDTTGGFFTANIFTSPLKKYQVSSELGVNVSQGLPGPFVNASLKVRNVFRGLESMSLSGKFGVEGVASATDQSNVYSSVEYGTNLSLVFPQFLFPLGKPLKSRLGSYNPRTTLTAGLNYTDRPEYLRNNINMRIDYSWQKSTRRQFTFTPGDFSFIDSQVSNAFDSLLTIFAQNGNNLKNSFLPSFVSSSSAAIVYNFNNYGNNQKNSSYLRLFIENGGLLLNFFNEEPFGKKLEYYQWIKLSADYRAIRPIKQSSVAYRIHLGVAYATGANETLPYEKFFFAGGSNSLRAWRPRRLGPGSYKQTDENGNVITSFEQPGDIILESSVEYRHKIFGFVNGAVFFDLGNVWTIREDQNRPGSQFKAGSFINDIAVGAGYGLRFDFSFLILRFDASVKMYDPSRSANGAFIWQTNYDLQKYPARNEITLNIGIGHPF